MIVKKAQKQPVDRKDYPISCAAWLNENTPADTLATGVHTVECLTTPGNTSLVVADLVISPTGYVVWVEGGDDGEDYKVSITLTTADGRVDQQELIFAVVEI